MADPSPHIDAPIEAVTVYREGAVVTRVGQVLGATRRLQVGGLPLCLDDASVVARLEGDGAPVVAGVQVSLETTDLDIAAPPEQAALDDARDQERAAADAVEELERRFKALLALASPDRPQGKEGEPPPPVPVDARLALLAFRRAELDAATEQLDAARETLRAASEQTARLVDQLRRATTARAPRAHELRKVARLDLVGGDGDGPWRLSVEYRVPGARWTPGYTISFDGALQQAELELRATVAQNTGEDWRGVALTLSSALPVRWTELPELPALRIGRRQPAPAPTGWRAPPVGAEALLVDFDAALAAVPRPQVVARSRPVRRPSPPPPADPVQAPPVDDEIGDEEATIELMDAPVPEAAGGAPPPAPMAKRQAMPAGPQAPMAMPAAISRSRGAGTLGRIADVGAELTAAFSAGAPPVQAAEPPPPALTAPDHLLDYGRLHLPPPDSPRRGQLEPAAREELYSRGLDSRTKRIGAQLLSQVDRATADADLSRLSFPPGHRPPRPVDDHDFAWRADHPVDIDSDSTWHNLRLAGRRTTATRHFVVVPRERREVYRFARFDNPMDAPLPAGPADVFVDGALLLTTPLNATDRGASVGLGLGVEEGIKVSRNTRFTERSAGLLGGSLSLEHVIEITIANNLSDAARVEVRERIPVVREGDDEVEVAKVSAEPPWEAWEQEDPPLRGGHRWVVEVGAKQQRQLRASYCVELSSKKELVGGNRREA